MELCPLRDITAHSVTKQIEREWIGRHGPPETLLTDQGQQVDGTEVRQLCEDYGIKKKRSFPYHPEGDGVSERQIGVMKGLFRTRLTSEHLPARRWPELLPEIQLSMNNKRHSSTKYTPFELMYGGNPRTRNNKDTRLSEQGEPECSTANLQEETSIQKQSRVAKAQENLQAAAENMKKQYDTRVHQSEMQIGDRVYVKKNYVGKGESRKLSPLYDNLSEVIEVKMPILHIKNLSSGKIQWRHHNQLKKCYNMPTTTTTSPSKKTTDTTEIRFAPPPTKQTRKTITRNNKNVTGAMNSNMTVGDISLVDNDSNELNGAVRIENGSEGNEFNVNGMSDNVGTSPAANNNHNHPPESDPIMINSIQRVNSNAENELNANQNDINEGASSTNNVNSADSENEGGVSQMNLGGIGNLLASNAENTDPAIAPNPLTGEVPNTDFQLRRSTRQRTSTRREEFQYN